MPIKQSFCLPCFHKPDGDLPGLLRAAAEIGFSAVEMWHRDESIDRTASLARENGLVLASMCGHRDWRSGLNRRENHDRIDAELSASIDVAARLGIPNLICFSGPRDAASTADEPIETTAAGVRRVIGRAEQYKVTLNIELLNSKVDHPGYECDHTAWAVDVCRRVNSERFRILYDVYHMQIME